MCGLVGVAGDIFAAEKRAFTNLLILDRFRGPHSTGVGVVNKNNDYKTIKAVGPTENLLTNREHFDDDGDIRQYNLKALIGHNRWATVGAKTAANAHPFEHGNILGAHNGTLKYLHELPNAKKFEVDSEAIFYNINKIGIEETTKHLNGAWALTWYDKESDTMNFMRNEERPLHYVYSKYESTIFWASKEWMLEIALDYAHIKTDEIQEFKPFHHYTLDMKGGGSIKNKDFSYNEEEWKGFTPPVVKQSNQGAPFYGNFYRNFEDRVNNAQTSTPSAPKGNVGNPQSTEDVKKMKQYIHKDIEFFIKGVRTDSLDNEYLHAESVATGEYWEIRLYAKDHKLWNKLKDDRNNSYSASVRKIVDRWDKKANKPETYMLIDLRTLSDPILWMKDDQDFLVLGGPAIGIDKNPKIAGYGDNPWSKTGTYFGWGGKELTYTEFVAATRNGCDWCCEDAEGIHPPNKLAWIGANSFICPVCNKDEFAADYIGSLVRNG